MKLGCLIVDCFDVHGFGEVCWADCLGRLVICGPTDGNRGYRGCLLVGRLMPEVGGRWSGRRFDTSSC